VNDEKDNWLKPQPGKSEKLTLGNQIVNNLRPHSTQPQLPRIVDMGKVMFANATFVSAGMTEDGKELKISLTTGATLSILGEEAEIQDAFNRLRMQIGASRIVWGATIPTVVE